MTDKRVTIEQVIGGFYHANTIDFTSAVIEILKSDGSVNVFHRSWITEEALYNHTDLVRDDIRELYREDTFELVHSKYLDYTFVSDWFVEYKEKIPIKAIGYDPYNGTALANHLEDLGFNTIPIRQAALTLNKPTEHLIRIESAGKIIFDNMMRRYFSNVEIKSDKNTNHFPGKKKRTCSIAGFNALINAHAAALFRVTV
ncbi:terminase TerL endonuclease subunit [Bacillus amyloliquefaciens]|uniref:terminase TerL endonuclease subunit n=1 Tax=Bacillus amyloliquefaciens TaxID=1390 RepID=UPI002DBC702A|nr:terminase TerL endonuclease subunit [Bacillus amyloliquefaciens]MEC3841555.1 terminase large subunit [Bacillus amyloliquefaciens]